MLAHVAGGVEADIDADGELGGETDEPGVLVVVRGAGLAGDRTAELLGAGSGAALHHALHHRGDLVGGHRVEHLLAIVDDGGLVLVLPAAGIAIVAAAFLMAEDGLAVAVLNTVDQ